MKQIKQINEKHVTVKDVAGYCLVSSVTVRRWIKDGKLSATNLPSGHYRVTTAGFRAFLERYNIPVEGELFNTEYKKKEEI